tara:strand:+ start:9271 stop:9675 length:405 start_codon:yes stop_codon:yes gene_type:complete
MSRLGGQLSGILVDIGIFRDRRVSFSEALMMWLEGEGFSNAEIGRLLGRDGRTVWTILDRGHKKVDRLKIEEVGVVVGTGIFRNRRFSILEAMVMYLVDSMGIGYREIGRLLGRSEKTVWTVYRRVLEKKSRGR